VWGEPGSAPTLDSPTPAQTRRLQAWFLFPSLEARAHEPPSNPDPVAGAPELLMRPSLSPAIVNE